MARKPRVHYPGAFYHVTLRGNDRQCIFFADDDRRLWEKILIAALDRYAAVVHGYCWMTNHVHMIVQVGEQPLASTMRYAASQYSRKINLQQRRTGHLFERRHGAQPVQDDSYLKGLIRYIHNNPVRAGLSDRVDQYPWSSHLAYAGRVASGWLETRRLLRLFGPTRRVAIQRYLSFMQAGDEEDLTRYRQAPDREDEALEVLQPAAIGMAIANGPRPATQTLESIIRHHLRNSGINEAKLVGPSRARFVTRVRTDIVMDALENGVANIAELARRLGRSEAAICQAVASRRNAARQKP